jgi:long-chain acyl-CoA synthetase
LASDIKVEIDPDAPVMYQFSSGTTGRPKRVARTHENLLFELNSFIQALDLTKEDRFLGVAPFSHVNGLMRSMMASVRAGATLYPLSRFERQAVAEILEKNAITIFIGVPFMFTMLCRAHFRRRPDFSALRLCVSASAPMPKKHNLQFHESFGIYVRQLYGSTETGTISVNLSSEIERSLESVGKPIAGVEVEVFTEDGQFAKAGEMGEFAVRSPAAIKGYDGLDEINKQVFRSGYFFTGDLGRREDEGLLYLMGRKKFFINRGGYKIDPREIEELLENHPKVEEAIMVGVPTPFGDEKGKAVIVLNAPCTEEEIIKYCQGKIADFKIPSLVEFRDSLPKSPTGKIRRNMLIQE